MTTYQYGYFVVHELGTNVKVETHRGLDEPLKHIPESALLLKPLVDILNAFGAQGWCIPAGMPPRQLPGGRSGWIQFFLVKEMRDAA